MRLDYLEIRSQEHLMNFEGSHESEEPSIEAIEEAVKNRGYESANVDCWWDDMFKRWNFCGDLIHNKPLKKIKM